MKLKYYLRGLGIGIIVTTVILMLTSPGKKDSMTDEEIIARARELGMVTAEETEEKTQQEDAQTEEDAQIEEDLTEENKTKESEENQTGQEQPQEEAKDSDEEAAQPDGPEKEETGQTDKEDSQEAAAEPVVVTVEINQGEYSDRISAKLLEAGLITDAEDFNKYLTDTGVDSSIIVGQHQIPQGADYEEIAKILCEKPENQ